MPADLSYQGTLLKTFGSRFFPKLSAELFKHRDLPWIKTRPILDFQFIIPGLEIKTRLLSDRYEMRETEYIVLFIRVFGRWQLRIRLYNFYEKIMSQPQGFTISKKRSI